MIMILLGIRLRSLFYGMFRGSLHKKKRGIGFKILISILVIYILASFFTVFYMLFNTLCEPLAALGLGWFYFALAGIIIFVFCFIGSIFATQTQIFDAKDNDLLLAMPIQPSAILSSRLAVLIFMNYLYEAFVILPAGIIWFSRQPATVLGIAYLIISALLLPLLALALSCLFGWFMALLSSKLRNKNFITMVLSIAFLLTYFWLYSHVSDYITKLIANGTAIADAIEKAVFPAYHMGNAIANGSSLSMLLFALCAIVPFAIVYALLSHNFIKIVTANRGAVKIKYREKAVKASGIRTAFVKKELRHFVANPMYILNTALGSIFMIILAVMLVVRRDIIYNFVSTMPDMNLPLSTIIAAALCLLAAANIISAPSISLEGNNLWIAKSLPVKPLDVLLSKAMMHIVVGVPFVLVSAIVSAIALSATASQAALLVLLPTVFTVLTALFGVTINLHFPKFDWISETHAIKQSISTMICMFGSMAVLGLLGIFYYFVLNNFMALDLYLGLCTILFAILSFALYQHLKNGGSRIFESL